MIDKLESLADAITEYSGYRNPESDLYQARNPGGLKAWDVFRMRDLNGFRVYSSFKGGYASLVEDLRAKCEGKSHTTLTPQSSLKDLMGVNGYPEGMCGYVVKFVRRALQDQSINEHTEISYFV